uniref:Uncharacterized protein n=1 Tax=Romanomermis culicivorax TaxID=13658 RepID=A0A915I2K0_ROMCU
MTDGNLQPNGTKISLSFGNVVSIAFHSVPSEKGNVHSFTQLTSHEYPEFCAQILYDSLPCKNGEKIIFVNKTLSKTSKKLPHKDRKSIL